MPGVLVSFVVEETGGQLKIADATEFPASELESDRSTWNGFGTPAYRWRLLDSSGNAIDAGDIARAPPSHTPADPGHVPVPIVSNSYVFFVRTPLPGRGQTIEISAIGRNIPPARWQSNRGRE